MKIRGEKDAEKQELNMTSMIDIVFLLLVFFVMTFKIVELEGDFSVRMPLAGSSNQTIDNTDLPLTLRMRSDAQGRLVGMSVGERDLGVSFEALRGYVLEQLSTSAPSGDGEDGPELEIDTDYQLRYAYVIEAITAVSGYKDGEQVVKLIDKIKFAKPRRG